VNYQVLEIIKWGAKDKIFFFSLDKPKAKVNFHQIKT
jgi:hypothetical protein